MGAEIEGALRVAAVVLGVPLVIGLFGRAVLGWLGRGWLDGEERFVASWGVGITFLGLGQLVAFVLRETFAAPVSYHWSGLAVVGLMLGVGALGLAFGRRGGAPDGPGLRWLVGLTALGYVQLLCLQALLPCYVGSEWTVDWLLHYQQAEVFIGRQPIDIRWGGSTLATRNPLFNQAAACVMAVLGPEFWVYQLTTALFNVCFLGAGYLVLRDLFGPRAGRLGLALAALNVWLLHMAWFTWPKMLTAYFLLLGLHFYLRSVRERAAGAAEGRRSFLAFWVCGLLAFMTHQAAAPYVAALLLHAGALALADRRRRPRLAEVGPLAVAVVVLVLPWYGWLVHTFGVRLILESSGSNLLIDADDPPGPWGLASSVARNLHYSTLPKQLAASLGADGWDGVEVYRSLTVFYFSAWTGALTVSLCAFLLGYLATWAVCKLTGSGRGLPARSAPAEHAAVWMFALLGGLGTALLHPWVPPNGIAHCALFPSVLALLLLGWGALAGAPRPVRVAVAAAVVLEGMAVLWSHLWLVAEPLRIDWTDYNTHLKEKWHTVFAHDGLPATALLVLTGVAVATQALLAALMFRGLWDQPDRASDAKASGAA